ncbi:6518_t:CDS:2, partial [Gigaspora rosea]
MPSISNYLGIPSSQIEEYYIKLNLQTFSQSFGSTGNTPYYADIEIFYQNFLALNLLSKLGGALTLALTVVVYL